MIKKAQAGCGLSDVLLEAGLIGSAPFKTVLTGKHYERAMHSHMILSESLVSIQRYDGNFRNEHDSKLLSYDI